MSDINTTDLRNELVKILKSNDQGQYTMPAPDLYPHQWLWDSCFIAIGLRHIDVDRAQLELKSLLRGQWHNGMLPHMIFDDGSAYHKDRRIWRSWLSPSAPSDVSTSGITQPPVLAEAVFQVGQKLKLVERRSWYKNMLPALIRYHQWIYNERDPHGEGLALLVHPWETGLDNTPPWMSEMHNHLLPFWIRTFEKSHLSNIVNLFRRDTRSIAPGQRFDATEALAMFTAQQRLKRKAYQTDKILNHALFSIEDLAFNCMLIRANQRLIDMSKTLHADLPEDLMTSIKKTEKALENLWDPYTNQYYPRDFITHKLIKETSVATLLPLYAGTISQERAKLLVKQIENEHMFGPAYPLPSTPLNSAYFDSQRYWQGPSWLNINWMVIDGLRRYGYNKHADALVETSIEMISQNGCSEYYDPTNGKALGAKDFSWTAALAIDLLA